MFNGRYDKLICAGLGTTGQCNAAQCTVVTFAAAAGKDNFVFAGTDAVGNGVAGLA